MKHCDICKRPIASGDICRCCEIRMSERKAIYRKHHDAVRLRMKVQPHVETQFVRAGDLTGRRWAKGL